MMKAARREGVQATLADFLADLWSLDPQPKRIHRMRVATKKLRGWVRLLRYVDGRRTGTQADRDLRAVARCFSAERDRQVVAHTLNMLKTECHEPGERRLLAELRRRLQASAVEVPWPSLTQAAIARLWRLCARQPAAQALLRALDHSYKRARRRGARAVASTATPQLRHRWRKRVKYLYYQSRFVSPNGKSKWQRTLADLGSTLGEMHDIDELRLRLGTVPGEARTLLAEQLIARALRRRLARVRRLYRRGFASKHPPALDATA